MACRVYLIICFISFKKFQALHIYVYIHTYMYYMLNIFLNIYRCSLFSHPCIWFPLLSIYSVNFYIHVIFINTQIYNFMYLICSFVFRNFHSRLSKWLCKLAVSSVLFPCCNCICLLSVLKNLLILYILVHGHHDCAVPVEARGRFLD